MEEEYIPRLKPRKRKKYSQGDVIGKHGWTLIGRAGDKWAMICPRCGNVITGIPNNVENQAGCGECAKRGRRIENLTTGAVYKNLTTAAKINGINPSTLHRAIQTGHPDYTMSHRWGYTNKPVTVEAEEEEVVTLSRSQYEELVRRAGEDRNA